MSKNNTNSAPVRKKRSQLVEIWRRMRRNRLAMLQALNGRFARLADFAALQM